MSRTTSRPDERKSGRVLVRMPISMHEYLFDAAQAEGISSSAGCSPSRWTAPR
jgi:predicted HicB family RNase H-like nuclease